MKFTPIEYDHDLMLKLVADNTHCVALIGGATNDGIASGFFYLYADLNIYFVSDEGGEFRATDVQGVARLTLGEDLSVTLTPIL